jgi:predicted phosphoribosyltransferase
MPTKFKDRIEAGKLLAEKLSRHAHHENDTLVLALPRGGVPVAYEVASALRLPLDVFIVRKISVPGYKEFAIGAITSDGTCALNRHTTSEFHISNWTLNEMIERETQELEKQKNLYGTVHLEHLVQNKNIILVDDGIATGSTMLTAISALRQKYKATKITVAVPVVPLNVFNLFKQEADEFIALKIPKTFYSVSHWYENFQQVTDDDVLRLLKQSRDQELLPGSYELLGDYHKQDFA